MKEIKRETDPGEDVQIDIYDDIKKTYKKGSQDASLSSSLKAKRKRGQNRCMTSELNLTDVSGNITIRLSLLQFNIYRVIQKLLGDTFRLVVHRTQMKFIDGHPKH